MKLTPKKFWTVTEGMSGHFAVLIHVNEQDIPGVPFYEPYDTGLGRYDNREDAVTEAKINAEVDNLPFLE